MAPSSHQKGKFHVPKSWLKYSAIGDVVESSRFLPFKTPISRENFCARRATAADDAQEFTVENLISEVESRGLRLGMVVNLCSSSAFYDVDALARRGVGYARIRCRMSELEANADVFRRVAKRFFEENADANTVIGVHCLHGLNRTGYMVCAYLVREMGDAPADAARKFETARGHPIESTRQMIMALRPP